MKPLEKLERRFGGFALPHLTLGIIGIQGLTFLAAVSNPGIIAGMNLDTARVLSGEWWRLITFMMMPPSLSPIWTAIGLYVLYLTGGALENAIGHFRYNLYWLVGYLASLAAAFLVPGTPVSNAYLTTSVFLAFAMLYPNFEFLLFFILPVKVKWLALLTWLLYAYTAINGVATGDWSGPAMVAAATANFFLFFGLQVVRVIRSGQKNIQRQRESLAAENEPFHRCTVCGKTDLSHPATEFFYTHNDAEQVVCFCKEHVPGGTPD